MLDVDALLVQGHLQQQLLQQQQQLGSQRCLQMPPSWQQETKIGSRTASSMILQQGLARQC
jgi:hypothetical protein